MSQSLAEADQRTCRVSHALGIQPCPLQFFRGPPRAVWFIVAGFVPLYTMAAFPVLPNSFLGKLCPL